MIIPDINLLVCAYNADAKRHAHARQWWERTLALPEQLGIPWVTILGFIRISTQRRIVDRPMRPTEATERVRTWLRLPNVQIISPGEGHTEILFGLLDEVGLGGDLTTDAHLAALAIEHGGQLASADTDFARFRGLRWFNPLEV